MLLFPTGRPVSPRWRWAVGAFVLAGLLFVVQMGTEPDALHEPGTRSYLELPFYHSIDGFWQVVTLLGPPQLALIVTSLALRYRRGGETERRQLLWLVLAVIVAFAANLQRYVTGDGPILLLLSFQLIPAAVAIAIVRYQLFDIRLVVSRTVLYLLLTLGVIAAYVALVDRAGRGAAARGRQLGAGHDGDRGRVQPGAAAPPAPRRPAAVRGPRGPGTGHVPGR